MNNLPTDKIYCAVLKGQYKIYLNKQEFDFIGKIINSDATVIQIGDKIIIKDSILFVIPARDIEDGDRIKHGDWKCRYNEWHIKGEECGHNLVKR